MDEKISFTEGLQKFRIANAINNYFQDSTKYDLYYTDEIILLYLDKDKISFEDKLKKMSGEVSKLELEVDKYVPENFRNIGKHILECARAHLEDKLPKLEEPLEIDVEYWCMISDIRTIETMYGEQLPKRKSNIDRLASLKVLKITLELYDMKGRIELDGKEIGD